MSLQEAPDMRVFSGHSINRVFVYGTLKGEYARNGSLKTAGAKLVGTDTLRGFLFHPGHAYFPAFVPEPKAPLVHGEVWEWPDPMQESALRILDGIEGVPHLYFRLPFQTTSGRIAWAYWQSAKNITPSWRVLPTGKWIGNKTPETSWETFIKDHPDYRWPTKPKMRFMVDVRSSVVDQSGNETGAWPYPQAGLDTRDTYKNLYDRTTTVRPALPAPTPPPVEVVPKKSMGSGNAV